MNESTCVSVCISTLAALPLRKPACARTFLNSQNVLDNNINALYKCHMVNKLTWVN